MGLFGSYFCGHLEGRQFGGFLGKYVLKVAHSVRTALCRLFKSNKCMIDHACDLKSMTKKTYCAETQTRDV